jgi:hypothetical protein
LRLNVEDAFDRILKEFLFFLHPDGFTVHIDNVVAAARRGDRPPVSVGHVAAIFRPLHIFCEVGDSSVRSHEHNSGRPGDGKDLMFKWMSKSEGELYRSITFGRRLIWQQNVIMAEAEARWRQKTYANGGREHQLHRWTRISLGKPGSV